MIDFIKNFYVRENAMEPDEVFSPESVGQRLRWLRLYLDMSQTEFAEACGITAQKYNNWERGRQRLSLEGALKLCKAYGVNLDFLYMGRVDILPHKMASAYISKSKNSPTK